MNDARTSQTYGQLAGHRVTVDIARQPIFISPICLDMTGLTDIQRAAVYAGQPVDWIETEVRATIDGEIATPEQLRALAEEDGGPSGRLVLDWLDRRAKS